MTFLLKSMWQNVLRSNPLSHTTVRSRNLSSTLISQSAVSEVSRSKSPDEVMSRLQRATAAVELLGAVQAHLPIMTHKHMLQALRCLFLLQKSGKIDQNPKEIIKNPTFSILCQNFKKQARALDVSEAIEATKVLSYLQVPLDSLIVQTMLQIVRCNINSLNARQIMFLDFILSCYDCKNHLVDALKLALPLAFQIRLPLELDNEDLPLLKSMLAYSCTSDLPDRCINNIVTGLLLHDQIIDAQNAKSIIWSLCLVNCTESVFPTRVQLLHNCFDILTQRMKELSYEDLLKTAAKIKGRVLEKHPEYYHEQLMDAMGNYIVDRQVEFEKGLLVARILSRIAHTHLRLVEYLCQTAATCPTTLSSARPNILFGFINSLSNNNFTPNDAIWTELRRQISLNPILESNSIALPWIKLCLELASLNVYEDKVLSRVFSKEFQDEFLARDNNILDYLQLLTLHEAVKCFHTKQYVLPPDILAAAKAKYPTHSATEQLQHHLALGLGGKEYVANNVVLPSGIITDLVVCLKGGYPISLSAPKGQQKVPLEQLNIPSNSVVVCIMNFGQGCYSMNSSRLRGTFRLIVDTVEHSGVLVVPLDRDSWLAAPSHERTPYLMREVAYKAGEVGVKLLAT